MTNRYSQLINLVRDVQPSIIVEVGVHRAARAAAMINEALLHSKTVTYIGFDVFETKDEAFQKAAMNGKGTPTKASAEAVLNAIKAKNKNFSYNLIVGDTRDTLHGIEIVSDFAFIDGDHRVEAIRKDYGSLKRSRCIVFDDYIIAGQAGECPDLTLYGANAVVDELKSKGEDVFILPIADLCKHGGFAKMAVLRH